ncbi:MAG: GNAT family N-acetyltransferase [Gemmatimonadaceae bacterium]|nr:GNAT family N-acetyltransferase [Gemmatimonadaceae bacterium]
MREIIPNGIGADDLHVDILCPDEDEMYTRYVAASPSPLIYATLAYRDMLVAALGCTPRYFIARDACERVVGVMPAMLSATGPWGPVLNSLPFFGSNGGVIVHNGDERVRQALLDAFRGCAVREGCAASTVITSPFERELAMYEQEQRSAAPMCTFRDERIGLLTPLPSGGDIEAELLASFSDPRPRNIRRAISAGVSVAVSDDLADWQFLHATHVENISAIGGRVKSWEFFATMRDTLPSDMRRLYVTTVNGERVAALLLLYANKSVEYFTPATVASFRSLQPLSLAIFRGMADAAREGYAHWNWGGTWLTQGGVYDFKRRWGTDEHRYYYYTHIHNAAVLSATTDELLAAYPNFYVAPFRALVAERLAA